MIWKQTGETTRHKISASGAETHDSEVCTLGAAAQFLQKMNEL